MSVELRKHFPPPSHPPPAHPPSDIGSTTALDISLVASVLLLAILLQQKLKASPRAQQFITGSGACMLLGGLVNSLLFVLSRLDVLRGQVSMSNPSSNITHNLIYFGLLPPIIFEAGFHMRKRQFFANLGTILSLAVLGTLISLVSTGALVWLLALPNAPIRILTPFTLAQAMTFGSLISSTDPVATLGILKHVNATPLLNDLIFGESALNDALSIVFFDVFLRATTGEASPGGGGGGGGHGHHWWQRSPPPPPPAAPPTPPPSGVDALPIVGDVLRILFGSIGVGVALALLSAFVTKRLRTAPRGSRPHPASELALLLLFALLAFSASERLGLSGVMALFFGSIAMRHYTFYNLSRASRGSARVLFTTLSEASETCLAVSCTLPPPILSSYCRIAHLSSYILGYLLATS